MQVDWNNGNIQLFREQANARTKIGIIFRSVRLPSGKTNTFQRRSARRPRRQSRAGSPIVAAAGNIKETYAREIPQAFHETLEQAQAI